MIQIEETWLAALGAEFDKEYFRNLTAFVHEEYRHNVCYPPGKDIFNAFNLCPLPAVKVVILGQDPYHGAGQAEGLCFSVKEGVDLPPSLVNIFKEIKADVGTVPEVLTDAAGRRKYNGSLRRWARQGVFLLNATLTVREHQAASHQRHGWEEFTDAVIKTVSDSCEHVVFLLWGSFAIKKQELVAKNRGHLILTAPHPSPLSAYRGFFGCKHFSKANEYLKSKDLEPIDWSIK